MLLKVMLINREFFLKVGAFVIKIMSTRVVLAEKLAHSTLVCIRVLAVPVSFCVRVGK